MQRSYRYKLKNAFSIDITLTPNIQLISNMQMNGRDIRPLMGKFLGRIDIGPWRKNFVMPNELAHKLITRETKGRAWLKSVNDVIVYPAEFFG